MHGVRDRERREGGSEVGGKRGTALTDSLVRMSKEEKAGTSPSLSFHPYRPVAAVSCEQLLFLGARRHISINPSIAGTLDVLG